MKFAFVAFAFLGAAGAAFADGPIKLTDAQLDAVTAGRPVVRYDYDLSGFALQSTGRQSTTYDLETGRDGRTSAGNISLL